MGRKCPICFKKEITEHSDGLDSHVKPWHIKVIISSIKFRGRLLGDLYERILRETLFPFIREHRPY